MWRRSPWQYGLIAVFGMIFYVLLGYAKGPGVAQPNVAPDDHAAHDHDHDSAKEASPEPDFATQLAAVRAGKSVEIRLRSTPVADEELAQLAGIETLRRVNVERGEFTDAGLASLVGVPKLELLRIHSERVTDAGMAHIAGMQRLRFLHLIRVPITDVGLKELHAMKQLESFYLDGGQTTDDGLQALLTALPELHFHKDQLHLPGDRHAHPH